jgi:hypothetical protein
LSILDSVLGTGPALEAVTAGLKLASTPEGLTVIRQIAIRPDISADDLLKKVHEENKYTQGPAEAPDAPELPKGK